MATLTTSRLLLREMTVDDLDDMAALLGDPEVMRYYPRLLSRGEALGWIEWNRRLYRARGFGLWAMVSVDDGRFVGDCGLTVQRVDGVEEIEVGYHVRAELQGRGFATEAALACRDYARDVAGVRRLVAIINPENRPSRRVAEKVGLTLEKRTTGWGAGEREQVVYAGAL